MIRAVIALALSVAFVGGVLEGAELRRGPYLLARGAHEITIRWRTDALVDRAAVHWGTELDRLSNSQVAEWFPGNVVGTRDWGVRLTGLEPGQRYFYALEADWAWLAGGGAALSFKTASLEDGASLRFWFLGDSGSNRPRPGAAIPPFGAGVVPHPVAVREGFRRYLGSRGLDGIILLGDNAYPLGTDRQYQAAFFNVYRDELARFPLWPCVGNHDMDDAYAAIFAGGAPGRSLEAPFYYSFDVGNAHFAILDPWKSWLETNSDPKDPRWLRQLEWLRDDLKSTDRFWRIVVNHFPVYCDGNYDSDTNGPLVALREDLVPVFDAAGVDLALAGHDHTYQRTGLIRGHTGDRRSFDPDTHLVSSRAGRAGPIVKASGRDSGTIYIVSGTAGGARPNGRFTHPALAPLEDSANGRRGLTSPGSFVVEIDGQNLWGKQIDRGGRVLDAFHLIKIPAPLD